MNFGDFPDGGNPAALDYLVGYAAGNGAGSDRRWLRSQLSSPSSDDGLPLGSASLQWSDLYLAFGSVITWDSGNPANKVMLTHHNERLDLVSNRFTMSDIGATASLLFIQDSANNYIESSNALLSGSVPLNLVGLFGGQMPSLNISSLLSSFDGVIAVSPAANAMGIRINQSGSGAAAPTGSALNGFNEIIVSDNSSTNVVSGLFVNTTLPGSNWGSANTLTLKQAGDFHMLVTSPPTGSPGPHQVVALACTSRVAAGIGACPTLDLFGVNFVVQAEESVNNLVGNEYDVNITATGACVQKIGVNVGTSGATGSAGADVAYITGAGAGSAWVYGYSWFPNSIDGTIFGSQHATAAINGIDLSAATFSGSQIKLALGTSLKDAVDDAAAALASVPVGGVYRNGSILMVRVA